MLFGGMTVRTTCLVVVIGAFQLHAAHAQSARSDLEQAGEAVLEQIYEAMQSGKVSTLMAVAAERIDLTIFGASEVLSRSQARYVLQDFFGNYPPTRVTLHETSPSEGNWFASASYWHRDADGPLTVYLRMRVGSGGNWELRELRFGQSIAR